MSDESKPARKPRTSSVRVRIEVGDQPEGAFTDTEIAVADITERVHGAEEGPRFDPVLTTLEALTREVVNKARAQVIAYENLVEAREG
jgi:hypothetical protein